MPQKVLWRPKRPFSSFSDTKLRYKSNNRRITIFDNSNVQSHDQEEGKLKSSFKANSSAYTRIHDKIIKRPFNKNNVGTFKSKYNFNKKIITRACRIGTIGVHYKWFVSHY